MKRKSKAGGEMAKHQRRRIEQQTLFDTQPDSMPVNITACERCHIPLRVATRPRTNDAYPFRLAKVPNGVCANCVVTKFLYNTYPINMQLDQSGPDILLLPHMNEVFQGIIRESDMQIDEIDWGLIVQNWYLPIETKLTAINPYKMGDYRNHPVMGRKIDHLGERLDG